METQKILELVRAICIRIKELDSYLNKTKLIKLLYLIDIEYYRKYKETYTEFKWIFYKFGPWAHEYNEIYENLKSLPDFRIQKKALPPLEIDLITCESDEIDFRDIFPNPGDSLLFREIINKWAFEDLNRILNYVYFYTEPMVNAKKDEELDFTKIHKIEEIPKFKLQKGTLTQKQLKELRTRLEKKLEKKEANLSNRDPHGVYDELYLTEIKKMDIDYDY